jgi:bifunctional non-homologous end joining protein LigD
VSRASSSFGGIEALFKPATISTASPRFDGIYLGRAKGKQLIYAGKVDHGFDSASAKDQQARLKPLIRRTQPYAKKIAHKGIWVEPSLLAEIEYRAKSAEGKVRHPFFKGIRDDL